MAQTGAQAGSGAAPAARATPENDPQQGSGADATTGPADIVGLIRDVPDFPKPGVGFKDISPLLASADGFAAAVEAMVASHPDAPPPPVTSSSPGPHHDPHAHGRRVQEDRGRRWR